MRNGAGELSHIEVLLTAWGLWSLRDSARLGYPRQSIIYRLMREGVTAAAIKRLHASTLPSTTAVEATEAALVAMPAPLREAVKVRYLNLDLPGPQCADRLGMTRQGFAMTLNRAQWWLAGRLSR